MPRPAASIVLAAFVALAVPAPLAAPPAVAPKAFLWALDGRSQPVRTGGPLYWRGGAAGDGAIGLETHPSVYLVWWGKQWQRGFVIRDRDGRVFSSRALQRYVRVFFASLGGSAWAGVQTQYCTASHGGATTCDAADPHVGNPPHQLAGEWTDPAPVSSRSDSAVASVALRAAARLGYDPQATYVVLAPPGGDLPRGPVWCGFHSQTAAPGGTGRLQYAFIPWLNTDWPGLGRSGCGMHAVDRRSNALGNGIFDAWSIVTDYAYSEPVTEPDDFGGVRDGWNDDYSAEAADKCAWRGLRDVELGTHRFAVQPLWSNEANACVVSR